MSRARRTAPASLALAVLVLTLSCCARGAGRAATSPPPEPPSPAAAPPPEDRPFHEGTAGMQEKARALVAAVPGSSMEQRMETSRRLTAIGEPGVVVLIESLQSPDPSIRAFAAWTLGHASDLRALPGLRAATGDPVKLVSLEAAAARVRLGDDAGLVRLVEGLEDPDPRVRSRCIGILQSRIGDTLDYLPDDPPSEREAAVERWRVFLHQRGL